MISLAVGLVAALAWGVHDILVRLVSQKTPILPALTAVLAFGSCLAVPAALVSGEPAEGRALWLAIAGGVVFGGASGALYRAFRIGPVRLVAPIIGAYPVLSVGWAAAQGAPVTLLQWLAVLAIVLGVGVVAGGSDDGQDGQGRRDAIFWSVASAVGFALAFGLLQAASSTGAELTVTAVSRVAALVSVGALALFVHRSLHLPVAILPVLAAMGALDVTAHGAVTYAGGLPRPEFAVVTASVFGLVTVILARIFLGEAMSLRQSAGVLIVFAGVGYLAI